MKKLLTICATLLFVIISIFVVKNTQAIHASTDAFTSGYAKVTSNDCYILSKPQNDSGIFLLEQSYYVKVTEVYDEIYFKVQYLEFEGYVEKSKVQFVEEFPKEPFLIGITFDIYDLGNVCLRSTPETTDNDSNILCTIKKSSKNIMYYGKCTGEEAINSLGNIWYYCGYQDEYENIYKGYIYAPLTRNLSAISSSSESLTLVNIDNFMPIDKLLYLNLSTKNLLIVITALPTIFAIYLFVKPSKIIDKNN